MDMKRALKVARSTLRRHKRTVAKDKKQMSPKSLGKGIKEMEKRVESAEKVASEMSAQSTTTERIMRSQAKVDVRKQQRAVNEQKANLKGVKQKLKIARKNVDKLSREAKRTAEKYAVLIKAAGMTDGDRVTKLSTKAVARLKALDNDERVLDETLGHFEGSRLKLNSLKAALGNATSNAYQTIKEKVKDKTQELLKKKGTSKERGEKRDAEKSYEPKQYVRLAEMAVDKHQRTLRQANAMLAESKKKLQKEQGIYKHLEKNSAGRPAQKVTVQYSKEKVHEWATKAKEAEKEVAHSKKVLVSRRHLARVAIAVYNHQRAAPSELVDEEMHKTKEMFNSLDQLRNSQNKSLETEINSDAQNIAKLAMKPGGDSKVSKILGQAMKANKAGAALSTTLSFISKKLDANGWSPELKESDGLTRDEYDTRHLAIQQMNVANGYYGQKASQKLKLLLRQVDHDEDPGMPIHGISREQLRASERQNKLSLQKEREKVALSGELPHDVNDLESIVHTIHERRGMSRQQFHAAMEAITGREVSLGTTDADNIERAKAANRISQVQSSWENYKQQMKALDDDRTVMSAEGLEDKQQRMQEDLYKGRAFFDKQFSADDDMTTVEAHPGQLST